MKKIALMAILLLSAFPAEARIAVDSTYLRSLVSKGLNICLVYPDSAEAIGKEVLGIASQNKLPGLEAEALFLIGQSNIQKTDYDQAIESLKKALELFKEVDLYRGRVKTLFSLRQLSFQQGNLPLAVNYAEQAVEVLKEDETDPSRLAIGLKFLSDTYLTAQRLEDAQQVLSEAIEILEGTQDSIELANLLVKKANLDIAQSNPQNTTAIVDRAFRIYESTNDSRSKIEGLVSLAGLTFSLGYWERSRDLFQQVLQLQEESGYLFGYCRVLNNYAAVVKELEGPRNAIPIFEKALSCTQEFEDAYLASRIKRSLSDSYYRTGDFQTAYDYLDDYQVFQDSLQQKNYQEELSRLSAEYHAEKQALEIKSLELNNLKRTRERNFLIIGALLTLILLGYVFSISRIRKKAFKQVKKEKEQSDRLLKEKEELLGELKSAQTQMIESEKMASLGQLTAGIAHEINNPVNFVNGNAEALEIDFRELKPLLDQVERLEEGPDIRKGLESIFQQKRTLDMSFLLSEMVQLIGGIQRGSHRIKAIVDSLRLFSHQSEDLPGLADINQMLDLTLTILKRKLKDHHIEVEMQYGELPEVSCKGGRISQVFMNIIDNAIDAMSLGGRLIIQTFYHGKTIEVRIKDTGSGMTKEIISRLFDPFFTTKEVGKGTGLGLAISYGIIKEHRGEIQVESNIGEGTIFTITLPV